MTTQEKLMTVEEFESQYIGLPYELVEGVVVEIMPPGIEHGGIARRTGARMGDFVDAHHLGEVVVESGFRLSNITMRAPDVWFISKAKLDAMNDRRRFGAFAPDLAVEVISPDDRANEVQAKVQMFLDAGTAIVWVMYPALRQVFVHRSDHTVRVFSDADTLDGGDLLPGFQVAVADLFPPPDNKQE